jgi:predicted CopG family antitoxin
LIKIEVSEEVFVDLHRLSRSTTESANDVIARLIEHHQRGATLPLLATGDRSAPTAPPTAAGSTTRSPREVTPQNYFRPFIIESLRRRGGEAHLSQVLADVEAATSHVLTEADREVVSDGEERWRNAARWERNAMADAGLIDRSTPRGQWRLTRHRVD